MTAICHAPVPQTLSDEDGRRLLSKLSDAPGTLAPRDLMMVEVLLAEKPVGLAVRAIQSSTRPGENVLDLLGGSGSVLIACA